MKSYQKWIQSTCKRLPQSCFSFLHFFKHTRHLIIVYLAVAVMAGALPLI